MFRKSFYLFLSKVFGGIPSSLKTIRSYRTKELIKMFSSDNLIKGLIKVFNSNSFKDSWSKNSIKYLLFQLCFIPSALAEKGTESPAKTPTPTALEQFFPFIIIGLVFYFILIRPQQRRHKMHRDFLSQIKRGDEILTSSGIYGRIEGLTNNFIILEVAENVRIRVAKSQIASYTNETEKDKKQN